MNSRCSAPPGDQDAFGVLVERRRDNHSSRACFVLLSQTDAEFQTPPDEGNLLAGVTLCASPAGAAGNRQVQAPVMAPAATRSSRRPDSPPSGGHAGAFVVSTEDKHVATR